MVGGRPVTSLRERLFSVEFPEAPGALMAFLGTLGIDRNITLFHYRSHGTDYGRVLVAFEAEAQDTLLEQHLAATGYAYREETGNAAFARFLAPQPAV